MKDVTFEGCISRQVLNPGENSSVSFIDHDVFLASRISYMEFPERCTSVIKRYEGRRPSPCPYFHSAGLDLDISEKIRKDGCKLCVIL
jgi:hypothetical protein